MSGLDDLIKSLGGRIESVKNVKKVKTGLNPKVQPYVNDKFSKQSFIDFAKATELLLTVFDPAIFNCGRYLGNLNEKYQAWLHGEKYVNEDGHDNESIDGKKRIEDKFTEDTQMPFGKYLRFGNCDGKDDATHMRFTEQANNICFSLRMEDFKQAKLSTEGEFIIHYDYNIRKRASKVNHNTKLVLERGHFYYG